MKKTEGIQTVINAVWKSDVQNKALTLLERLAQVNEIELPHLAYRVDDYATPPVFTEILKHILNESMRSFCIKYYVEEKSSLQIGIGKTAFENRVALSLGLIYEQITHATDDASYNQQWREARKVLYNLPVNIPRGHMLVSALALGNTVTYRDIVTTVLREPITTAIDKLKVIPELPDLFDMLPSSNWEHLRDYFIYGKPRAEVLTKYGMDIDQFNRSIVKSILILNKHV